jgi:hypothetical protein
MSEADSAARTNTVLREEELNPLSPQFALTCIVAFAAILFIWKAMIALGNPMFNGDSAIRMLNAARPIARMGNRVWLPYLQMLIWGLAKLQVPYPLFNLIPCLHLFIATLALGLLGLRLIGRNWHGLLTSLVLMFCFTQQRVIARSSVALYQEIAGIALFFILLYGGALELARRRWLLIVGAAALLARDSMWIYLFALTLLHLKTILSNSKYRCSFAFLWAIPPLWLIAVLCGWIVFEGRMPTLPTEWPLMINKDGNQAVSSLADSFRHLWQSAFLSRSICLILGGLFAGIVHFFESRHAKKQNAAASDLAHYLKTFSLLSLAMCFGLIFLFDPWQFTAGSDRMYAPIVEQCFVWFILIAAATRTYRLPAKVLAMTALLLGMLASLDTKSQNWIPVWNSAKVSAYEEIAERVQNTTPGRKPMACMVGNQFGEMSDYCAAIYRASHKILPVGTARIPDVCDALYTSDKTAPPDSGALVLAGEYIINGKRFLLYLRPHQR